MMWKCIKVCLCFLIITILGFTACRQNQQQNYTYCSPGYYYRLIAYQPAQKKQQKKALVQLALSFKTQKDSVFWDSYNNFNDVYVVSSECNDTAQYLQYQVAKRVVGDSFELLIPCATFFLKQFGTQQIPQFSSHDSVVSANVKIKRYLNPSEYEMQIERLKSRENELIRNYFGTDAYFKKARDSAGVYWVQNPSPWSPPPKFKELDRLMVNYEGYFLSGRMFEKSIRDFELIYGIPDQMVKGLNYVMGQLNEGQTAKIILPSALAFGEKGSSNGTVPPFTPVLYIIKLTEVKRK
jgi:FKBP-type peptidyl-prolyl cis-trans isomerase FkpA